MQQPDRSSRASGRSAFAVLLAAVLLAVIGASAGVVAGRMSRSSALVAERQSQAATASDGAAGSGRATGGASPHGSASRAAPTSSAQSGCPSETAKAVGDKLTPVLYVETDQSEVWICRAASGGRLWYQGHRKTSRTSHYPEEQLIEGSNALLLGNVEKTADAESGYQATNTDANGHTTRYVVTATQLVISHADGTIDTQPATRHVP